MDIKNYNDLKNIVVQDNISGPGGKSYKQIMTQEANKLKGLIKSNIQNYLSKYIKN